MISPSRSRSLRPFAIAAVGLIAVVLTMAALAIGSGYGGACAYVPPEQRQHPLGPYVVVFGPPTVTFFVLAFFALGLRWRLSRAIALATTLVITGVVAFVSLMFLEPVCGL
jgi:hypothetical protein